MPYSPYEWNESVNQRNEFIEERLREGAPVVAISFDKGILMLTVRRTQRKIFEIYDKLMFSAIGNQSDIEAIRTGAIDIAHREGFTRSPDDVAVQRIVGFAVSPSIKKVYADPFAQPVAIRAVFAELGRTPRDDQYFLVGYDGEFSKSSYRAAVAGTTEDEQRMLDDIDSRVGTAGNTPEYDVAIRAAMSAWAVGRTEPVESDPLGSEFKDKDDLVAGVLREAFSSGGILEAAILERDSGRESRFRLLGEEELNKIAADYR